MASLPYPTTEYAAAGHGGDGLVEMNALDSLEKNHDRAQQDKHGRQEHYNKMASEIPQDRFDDEISVYEDDDNQSMARSIASSVLTADGIHDLPGFYVVCFVILIGDMSRGVFFPSMWPLVSELGGTQVTLGYSVAAFSFGRILVSPLFGSWSVTYGYSKTLLVSCSILFVGTLLYAQVQNVGKPQFLIFSQTILGVGSGTLGVTRAYIADITAQRNRTTYMAWITAVQYAGFTVTPFIGAIFNKTMANFDVQWGILRLNMYTAPAYFMSCVIAATIVLMRVYFRDRERIQTTKDPKKKSARRAAIDDHANQLTFIGVTVYDCCILGCMLLNVATKGSIGSYETLGINIAELQFAMSSARAGTIVASCGTVGVAALLSMGYLAMFFSDIQLICGGMMIMCCGILSLAFLEDGSSNPTWKFILSIFLVYSVGYPIGHTALIGLFSKIVGRRPQGTLLGWFASAGSFARLTFPIMSGYIANYAGLSALCYVLICILGVSTVVTLLNHKTLTFLSQ
ncbi:major facilitator superfamily transporter [Nitzschia inconspicua]|uniref:Major facilitator superfamily transporter n=1 Tax=Nitzschia inconspicua TaxID=303405 RepID=A0A9K3PUQ1_9STRA|nr:major facilitator superfamily transporter [Nitzschia inconspicua]